MSGTKKSIRDGGRITGGYSRTAQDKRFKQYRIPRSTDVLEMNTYAVEIPQGPGPFGAIGKGEAGHFPMASAIIASLNDACGIWIYDLPAKQERVLSVIQKK